MDIRTFSCFIIPWQWKPLFIKIWGFRNCIATVCVLLDLQHKLSFITSISCPLFIKILYLQQFNLLIIKSTSNILKFKIATPDVTPITTNTINSSIILNSQHTINVKAQVIISPHSVLIQIYSNKKQQITFTVTHWLNNSNNS